MRPDVKPCSPATMVRRCRRTGWKESVVAKARQIAKLADLIAKCESIAGELGMTKAQASLSAAWTRIILQTGIDEEGGLHYIRGVR